MLLPKATTFDPDKTNEIPLYFLAENRLTTGMDFTPLGGCIFLFASRAPKNSAGRFEEFQLKLTLVKEWRQQTITDIRI
jgi:hypothetical protein